MAGYSRQSVADIIANAVIKAGPVNAEYNAIRDAFAHAGGHSHDGSSTEGAFVPLISDTDKFNHVIVDPTNNRISIFIEVGGAAVEQVRIQDGAIVPVTDNDIDLGAIGAEYKDLYVDGIGYIDTVQVHENATVEGNLTVNGNTTLGNAGTDTVTVTAGVSSDVLPSVDGTYDLGSATKEWQDLWIDGTANIDSLVADTADINAGTIDNTVIGATTPLAATVTSLTATSATINGNSNTTGTATIATVDINAGNIDATIIGATAPAAATFTTATTTGQGTFPTVNIDGGTIDGTTIGATSATSITGTTITATTQFTGDLVGNVTGNTAGTHTGPVVGNVTGNLTGNVSAATGTSVFNNVTVNGTLDVTGTTIANVTDPVNPQDAATKNYVDTGIAALVDAAPGTLDTLNELAAALGDDPAFATTVTDSIATKLPLVGGTMSGSIAMGNNSITGMADPVSNQDAATKAYVDTQDATKLDLAGGIMTGNIVMGSNKVTSTATPTADDDLTRKAYVDNILGSATSAAASAAAAATSETNAATSASNAAASEANVEALYDSFDDRYLGSKASAPTVDNDGNALIEGALYWNSTTKNMYIWNGSSWSAAVFDTAGAMFGSNNLSDVSDVAQSRTNLGLGTAATTDSTSYATSAQGALADTAVQPNDSPTFVTVNATTVNTGTWTITESGGSLYFANGGTNKMKLDALGNLQVTGDVEVNATIS